MHKFDALEITKSGEIGHLVTQRDALYTKLEEAVKDLSEAYGDTTETLFKKLQSYQAGTLEKIIDSINNDEKLDEAKKADYNLTYKNLHEKTLVPFYQQGAVVISIDYMSRRVVLAKIPSIVNTDLAKIVRFTELIYVDFDGAINTTAISIPMFYALIDLAGNNTTEHVNLGLLLARALDQKDYMEMGNTIDQSAFVKKYLKNGYQLIARKSLTTDKDGNDDPNGALQQVLLSRFTHQFDKGKYNPEKTYIQFKNIIVDRAQDIDVSTDTMMFSKATATAFMGYFETLNPKFNTRRIYQELVKLQDGGKK